MPENEELTEAQLAEAPEVPRITTATNKDWDLPLQDDIDAERRALKERVGQHKKLATKPDSVGSERWANVPAEGDFDGDEPKDLEPGTPEGEPDDTARPETEEERQQREAEAAAAAAQA